MYSEPFCVLQELFLHLQLISSLDSSSYLRDGRPVVSKKISEVTLRRIPDLLLRFMINPDAKLAANIFDKPDMAPTRDGFGKGVVEAGKADERVVVLSADLEESTRAEWFHKEFPARFIEMGVAEQNMATVAAGMANYGKIPFFTSYAAFSPGRNWEQIR